MSRVYWHTRDHGTAELCGSERAHAHGVCQDLAIGLLRSSLDGFGRRERLVTKLADPPPLRLLAWMHGMCENHGYFEPEAQSNLAEVITEGLEENILRPEEGWDKVIELIARNIGAPGASPIVWSYSVTDSFPDPWMLPHAPDPDDQDAVNAWEEKWAILSGDTDKSRSEAGKPTEGEIWDACMEKLRMAEWPVALDPDVEQRFLNGKTVFDFMAQL